MRRIWLKGLLFALVAMALFVFLERLSHRPGTHRIAYSELIERLERGEVDTVLVSPTHIVAELNDRTTVDAVRIEDPKLVETLKIAKVRAVGREAEGAPWLLTLLGLMLPVVSILLVWSFMRRNISRGPGGFAPMGQSRPKLYAETDVKVVFDDVAGVDEAKEELQEVIAFLRNPKKLERLGGKIPKGVLLVGPPGTGKTLLARAVAGEANVPFFSISGSEFVELFVGVGAARVRDLFGQARERAPCIIFIDELDALGKVRGLGPGAHEEREQTLNQLLVEMDGFDPKTGVILMAATNRPEVLDPALLRSGRFDRHVVVDRPDMRGRLAILKVHARHVRLAPDVDLELLAQMTPGLVGADLANIINEGALLAERRNHANVENIDFQEAVERVVAGLEKKNRVLNRFERERVAHHEVGHAMVAQCLPGADPILKISIIPRGVAALGYTLQRPLEDRFLMTRTELHDKIAVLLGGRVAEELCFLEPSTGAQDDLRKATDIARSMVIAYGMSEALGLTSFEPALHPLWINGREPRGDHSEAIQARIDDEVAKLLETQHHRVTELLQSRLDTLRLAAGALLARETLTGDELRALCQGPLTTSSSRPQDAFGISRENSKITA